MSCLTGVEATRSASARTVTKKSARRACMAVWCNEGGAGCSSTRRDGGGERSKAEAGEAVGDGVWPGGPARLYTPRAHAKIGRAARRGR